MGQTQILRFTIKGMHCASCGLLIDDALADLPGVRSASTSPRARLSTVEVDADLCGPEQLIAAISAEGYTATLAKDGRS